MITSEQLPDVVENFIEALSEAGFRPKQTTPKEIVFYVEGFCHVLRFHDDDPSFAFLLVPAFYQIKCHDNVATAYQAANDSSRRVKGAKVFVTDDDGDEVSATVEFLLTNTAGTDMKLLQRKIDMIGAGMRHFRSKMDALVHDDYEPLH